MSDSIPVPQQFTDEIRVLHVDDDVELGEMVATFLERANDRLVVETVTTARDALDRLSESDFDCVVSDYDIAEMNGIEFLETLRETRQNLPFVLYTGKGSEEVASRALSAGATDYFQKETGTDHYSVLENRIVTLVERERAQTETDDVQHLFTELADSTDDILWLYTHDWEELLFLSSAYEDVFGQPRARVDADPTAFLDVVHPADRPHLRDAMNRLADGESANVEVRLTVGDDVRWVWIKGAPITDPTGRVTHLGGFSRDVTRKKLREQELETKNAQLEAAMEAGGVGTWQWDVQTDTVTVGSAFARTFGIEADTTPVELPLERFVSSIHEDDRDRVEADIDDALANSGSYETEYRVRNEDGELRWVIARGHVVCDDDGTPIRFPGLLIDITERKAREAELLDTQRKYEAMFEDPNILVCVLTPDGAVTDVNQTAMEHVDTTLEAMQSEPFWKTPWFGSDAELKRDVEAWVDAAAAGEYVSFESEITTPDGSRFVSGAFRPVTDEHGDVTAIIVSGRDITARREKERRLEESESRYRALAENFPNGIVTMFEDDLTYTLAAGRAFETLPVSEADVEGSRPSDVWGADVGAELETAFRDALTGTPTAVEVSYAGREWLLHTVPITERDGDVIAGMTIAQDVTERTRYQAELERALALMKRAEQIADVGSWEIDVDTSEVFWSENLFDILDREGEEPPLEEALDVYHEADRPRIESALEAAMEAGESFDVEARFRRPSGETRWLRIQGSPTVDDGEIVTLRGAVQDITDHKSYQQTLERQNTRLDEFASVVSHDLRNPLQVAEGNVELARAECGSEYLDKVDQALDRANRIIDNVLLLARNGRDIGSLSTVDPETTASDAWEITGWDHEHATLSFGAEDGLEPIEADAERLQQLFENLFRNSLEHAGTDVAVTVGSLPDGFYVEDDGPGIPAAKRETAFAAGYSTSEDGTGFGLAIVKQIAEAHGWAVTATAGTTGGARFEFTGVNRP